MGARLYLIAYDIADPHRLARVARCLERIGTRVQYSVFIAELTPDELADAIADLARLIDPREDDVRAYPLPHVVDAALLGRQIFPDDILLLRDGRNLLRLGPKAKRPHQRELWR
ncbi:CRISPR-associated Cas2 family protein [Plasticicumulans lactativorans]|uniref:CRISPR-associated endoribonuclease Cas2 n=1 Tax=Plasticicumulans lactativorans TaxID=1133106 RepID=A0A4R2L5P5_9GAMM|nr:CRISPR-associated endonuclease Cas2 [Plasticicumulans lactativorans]TCO80597.1 CRISPR-associated Cas2 family protein [Plasticicumulans lactativorans]